MKNRQLKQPIYRLPQDLKTVCTLLKQHNKIDHGRSTDVVRAVIELDEQLYTLRVAPDSEPKATKVFAKLLEKHNGSIPKQALDMTKTQYKVIGIVGLYAYLRLRKTDIPPGGYTSKDTLKDSAGKIDKSVWNN